MNLLCLLGLAVLCTFVLFSNVVVANGETTYNCRLKEATQFFQHNSKQADMVLSLTTMPERIKSQNFSKVLESFLFQSMRFKEIRLNVPRTLKRTGQAYHIPEYLSRLPLTIVRCDDEGPATKYLPTLRHFADRPDQRIAVYDDDSYMPSDWVEKMDVLTTAEQGTCFTSVGYNASEIYKNNAREFVNVYGHVSQARQAILDLAHVHVKKATYTEPVDILTGWSGYVLRPSMVHVSDLANFEAMPRDAFFVDDVVMSGCLAKKNTPIKIAFGVEHAKFTHPDMFYTLLGMIGTITNESLSQTENRTFAHDRVMADWFHGFKK